MGEKIKGFIKKHKLLLIIIAVIILSVGVFLFYETIYLDQVSKINLTLKGEKEIMLPLNQEYQEQGATASFRKKNLTKEIQIHSNLDNTKIGEYTVDYQVKYKKKKKTITRKVIVVDLEGPIINIKGNEKIQIEEGSNFEDPFVTATDNYDGDVTSKVVTEGTVDTNTPGNYTITYRVTDSSNNESTVTRAVEVTKKKVVYKPGIAVLNYHFFYSDGENCGQGICLNTSKFEEQLKYLKENNYKTLTMQEFVDWIYGRIELPQKSVLLTIDDGAMGTGTHNGNKLIPLLEKYQVHATLFLITGWWDINNYRSAYLDIESHTYDMHNEGVCSGVTRGARLLCSSHDEVINDLKKSIAITGSTKAFCYPFYAYNNTAIEEVKEAGFQVAFAGGGYKATRSSNKYAIPRFPIQGNITLDTFISYIS